MDGELGDLPQMDGELGALPQMDGALGEAAGNTRSLSVLPPGLAPNPAIPGAWNTLGGRGEVQEACGHCLRGPESAPSLLTDWIHSASRSRLPLGSTNQS